MSNTGLVVSGMNEPPNRYDVTVTAARDGGHLPDPAEFAVDAERALVADLVALFVESGVPVVLGTARPALERHMAYAPAMLSWPPMMLRNGTWFRARYPVNLNIFRRPSGNFQHFERLPSASLKVGGRSSGRNERTGR